MTCSKTMRVCMARRRRVLYSFHCTDRYGKKIPDGCHRGFKSGRASQHNARPISANARKRLTVLLSRRRRRRCSPSQMAWDHDVADRHRLAIETGTTKPEWIWWYETVD